jgi:hypothetical protein
LRFRSLPKFKTLRAAANASTAPHDGWETESIQLTGWRVKRTHTYGAKMKNDFSTHSTADLLRLANKEASRETREEALWCLFHRWQDGIDLEFLVTFLESNTTGVRLRGAYYLGEAIPGDERIVAPATKLASDPLPDCRRTFVGYILDSGHYDQAIANGLANGLFDFSHNVRVATINWAVYTTDDRFDHFSSLVESGSGATEYETWRGPELIRALRGLGIARRLRKGESVEEIRKSTQGEDSYTFDYFQVFESRTKEYVARRKHSPA